MTKTRQQGINLAVCPAESLDRLLKEHARMKGALETIAAHGDPTHAKYAQQILDELKEEAE